MVITAPYTWHRPTRRLSTPLPSSTVYQGQLIVALQYLLFVFLSVRQFVEFYNFPSIQWVAENFPVEAMICSSIGNTKSTLIKIIQRPCIYEYIILQIPENPIRLTRAYQEFDSGPRSLSNTLSCFYLLSFPIFSIRFFNRQLNTPTMAYILYFGIL